MVRADARGWLLVGVAVWLLAWGAVVATAAAGWAGAEPELTIEGIKADAYPRVTARFRIAPEVGKPPAHLELADVRIVEDGTPREPLEVYVVGRAPTERVGTYEAVWISTVPVTPGESVAGRLIVARWNRADLEGEVRFTRPLPKVAPAAPAQQRRVELPVVPLPLATPPDVGYVGSIAGVLAGVATLCGAFALVWRSRVRFKQERLATWVAGSAPMRTHAEPRAKASGRRQQAPISPMTAQLGKLGARLVSGSQAEKLKRNLILAGMGTTHEFTRFVAIKAGLGLLLLTIGLWIMLGRAPLLNALALSACMGLMGFLLPSTWLGRRIKTRQYNLRRALPDALDLMTIGVSAGLAFDGAIAEIVTKWDNDLSREFAVMLGELRMGSGRREALLNLAERTQIDEIQTMVSQLIQAEELGMSLTETLMTLSGQMRQRRRQRAEELAQKAAVKMLIPLVFLIFPALFIVILGPSVQDMYTFMQGTK